MVSPRRTENLLREWEAIMRRIESIDARIWQGAGILLVISIGGISLVGHNNHDTLADFLFVVFVGLVSIIILTVWWFIFHRWIHLQRLYSHRAREIENILDLRFNRYAFLLEYWKSSTATKDKSKLEKGDAAAYKRLEEVWEKEQKKKHFGHMTIKTALEWLTCVLTGSWLACIIFYAILYFDP